VLELSGISVGGLSIGGLETCIDLPAARLVFDIGRCPSWAVARPRVLLTHPHMDHLGGLAYHAATRALLGLAPPEYLVPRGEEERLEALFAAWRALDRSELPHRLVPLGPGEEHRLARDLLVRPVATPHVVPSQGYVLWRERRKLRPEHAGRSETELRRLVVEQGVEVSETISEPELAFTGDTRVEAVEQEPVLGRAKVLLHECTFLDDRVSVDQARATGHTHLYELAARAELFRNQHLVLTHFSARYSNAEIERLLDRHLPAELRARTVALRLPERQGEA
jgi:ribonuclease Z